MSLWIEVLSPWNKVMQRNRFDTGPVRIGRAYVNHVVLDDTSVEHEHLVVAQDPAGHVTAKCLENHEWKVDDTRILDRERVIDGDSILSIGRSRLRVRTDTYSMATTSGLRRSSSGACKTQTATKHVLASLSLLLGLVTYSLGEWAEDIEVRTLLHFIGDSLGLLFMVVPWVATWAVLTRASVGVAKLDTHLLIVGCGLVWHFLLVHVFPVFSFAMGLEPAPMIASLSKYLLWGGVIYLHLAVATGRRRLNAALLAGLLALVVASGATWAIDRAKKATKAEPDLVGLYPNFMRVVDIDEREAVIQTLVGLEPRWKAEEGVGKK